VDRLIKLNITKSWSHCEK